MLDNQKALIGGGMFLVLCVAASTEPCGVVSALFYEIWPFSIASRDAKSPPLTLSNGIKLNDVVKLIDIKHKSTCGDWLWKSSMSVKNLSKTRVSDVVMTCDYYSQPTQDTIVKVKSMRRTLPGVVEPDQTKAFADLHVGFTRQGARAIICYPVSVTIDP
jgi:hypothetical protein